MFYSEHGSYGSGSAGNEDTGVQFRSRREKEKQGVVFSAKGSFNPTNLAVEDSLKEIFDEFSTMVTGQLRIINLEEDD